jgi:hypothetical protein
MTDWETVKPKYVPPSLRNGITNSLKDEIAPITGFAPGKLVESVDTKYKPPSIREQKQESFEEMFPVMSNTKNSVETKKLNYASLFSKKSEVVETNIDDITHTDTNRIIVIDTSNEREEKEPSQWTCLKSRRACWLARQKAMRNANIIPKRRGNLFECDENEYDNEPIIYQSDENTDLSSPEEEEEEEYVNEEDYIH